MNIPTTTQQQLDQLLHDRLKKAITATDLHYFSFSVKGLDLHGQEFHEFFHVNAKDNELLLCAIAPHILAILEKMSVDQLKKILNLKP